MRIDGEPFRSVWVDEAYAVPRDQRTSGVLLSAGARHGSRAKNARARGPPWIHRLPWRGLRLIA